MVGERSDSPEVSKKILIVNFYFKGMALKLPRIDRLFDYKLIDNKRRKTLKLSISLVVSRSRTDAWCLLRYNVMNRFLSANGYNFLLKYCAY